MIKSYAVVFQNQTSGKVGMDIFSDRSEGMARKDFLIAIGMTIIRF